MMYYPNTISHPFFILAHYILAAQIWRTVQNIKSAFAWMASRRSNRREEMSRTQYLAIKTLRLVQNGHHFGDGIVNSFDC